MMRLNWFIITPIVPGFYTVCWSVTTSNWGVDCLVPSILFG